MSPLPRVGSQPVVQPRQMDPTQNVQHQNAVQGSQTGINAIVQNARPMPPPEAILKAPAQPQPSTAAKVGRMIGRVLLGIATIGISEGIRAAVVHARRGADPAARQPNMATSLTVSAFNDSITKSIMSQKPLPERYQTAANEALAELRQQFGQYAPAGETLAEAPFGITGFIREALSKSADYITPEQLSTLIKNAGIVEAKQNALRAAITSELTTIEHEAEATVRSFTLSSVEEFPALHDGLLAAASHQDLDAILTAQRQDIKDVATFIKTRDEIRETANNQAITHLSENLGIPQERVSTKIPFKRLENSFNIIEAELSVKTTPEAMRETFNKTAEKFTQRITELYYSTDELAVSEDLQLYFKNEALTDASIPAANTFRNCVTAATRIEAGAVDKLKHVFDGPEPAGVDELAARLEAVAFRMEEALVAQFTPRGFNDLGGDGQSLVRFYTAKALFDQMPEFVEALRARPELTEVLEERASGNIRSDDMLTRMLNNDILYMLMASQPTRVPNAQLATALKTPGSLSAPYLLALEQVKIEVGNAFPELKIDDDFFQKERYGIGNAITAAPEPVTPEAFSAIVKEKLLSAAAFKMPTVWAGSVLREAGMEVSNETVANVRSALLARHPELKTATTGAASVAILDGLKAEATALANVYHTIETSWHEQEANLISTLATAIHRPEDEVRTQLNTTGLLQGGTFTYLRADYTNLVHNPATVIDDFPSTADIKQAYQSAIDRFVARKSNLYTSIDGLQISDKLKTELKHDALAISGLKQADFISKCVNAAARMNPKSFLETVGQSSINDEDVYGLVRSLAEQYDIATHTTFTADDLANFGSDETSLIQDITMRAFFDAHPALLDINAHGMERVERLTSKVEGERARVIKHAGTLRNQDEINVALQGLAVVTIMNDILAGITHYRAQRDAEAVNP